MRPTLRAAVLLLVPAALVACGGGKADTGAATTTTTSGATAGAASGGLSEFELKHGIGPVTEAVEVGPVDEKEARRSSLTALV